MQIKVGILTNPKIEFLLKDNFIFKQKNAEIKGNFSVEFHNGKILFDNQYFTELFFENKNNSVFELKNVKIGIDFHWEQSENQIFEGNLKIIADGENLVAINEIDIEKYLCSVISSEMSAASFPELLKAHAVISRSWLLANLDRAKSQEQRAKTEQRQNTEPRRVAENNTPTTHYSLIANHFIKWYERDAHTLFDVCADDHCQRYQGTAQVNENAKAAVEATAGEILTYNGEVCDTRFSKCCGGKTEIFSACWADKDFDYLTAVVDFAEPRTKSQESRQADLTDESEARKWVLSSPECFCNTSDKTIINQVFKDFDKKTNDFFRWRVSYANKELSAILKEKSGIDFGKIIDLIPLKRGQSGRITLLKIVGTKSVASVGKELEIRRWLSPSHLYSSAFVVEKDDNGNFTLFGAGWGHGAGLCQIGAAVMSAKGYDYRQILAHYFKGTEIQKNKKAAAKTTTPRKICTKYFNS